MESGDSNYPLLGKSKGCSPKVMIYVLMILNLALLCVLIAGIYYTAKSTHKKVTILPSELDHLAQQYYDALPDNYFPPSYTPPLDYFVPPHNQQQRGTCWAFATIALLESQYKAQGVAKQLLGRDEYVPFSIQGWASLLGNRCLQAEPGKRPNVCKYGGFARETPSTNDNQIEALAYFMQEWNDLGESLMPETVCPYIPSQSTETDFQCPGQDEFLKKKKNPIKFTLKSQTQAYDTRGIKELLLNKGRPLGIGTPLMSLDYYIPCTGSAYAEDPVCKNKEYRCPDSEDPNEFCYKLNTLAYDAEGTFLTLDHVDRLSSSGGHAMNVWGYNDNWQYNNRLAYPESIAEMKGAFILHNSWGEQGHSIEYLMGQRTIENEMTVCPNMRQPTNWIPAKLSELTEKQGKIEECSTDIQRIRLNGSARHADPLVCAKTAPAYVCTEGKQYVLGREENSIRINAVPIEKGLYDIQILEVDPESHAVTSKQLKLPFYALYLYFRPAETVNNHPFNCGYWTMPYKTLENNRRINWDLFDNQKVTDFEFEFADSSYINSPESKKYDTTFLEGATVHIETPVFNGPIPFDRVYGN